VQAVQGVKLTGERVVTADHGHNATWQRHVSAYRLVAPIVTGDLVLDLGCGIGHSFGRLPGRTIGLDRDHESLLGQGRPVVQADMRPVPLAASTVSSVISVQSLEHVPDPHRVVAECARLLRPNGVAVFVTPNRLTFGPGDEIIDPWHYVEFDAEELASLCRGAFQSVEVLGLFGSPAYTMLWEKEMASTRRLLTFDALRLRRLLGRRARQAIYGFVYRRMRRTETQEALSITEADFELRNENLENALDLVAVCRDPRPPG
jgi:SAM-dependent methyltransferase